VPVRYSSTKAHISGVGVAYDGEVSDEKNAQPVSGRPLATDTSATSTSKDLPAFIAKASRRPVYYITGFWYLMMSWLTVSNWARLRTSRLNRLRSVILLLSRRTEAVPAWLGNLYCSGSVGFCAHSRRKLSPAIPRLPRRIPSWNTKDCSKFDTARVVHQSYAIGDALRFGLLRFICGTLTFGITFLLSVVLKGEYTAVVGCCIALMLDGQQLSNLTTLHPYYTNLLRTIAARWDWQAAPPT
jgi:hypothetical protein